MLEIITSADAWIAFITLTALELVLGIDNIIFITILVYKLPPDKRAMGRRLGLFLAMFMRIALLSMLAWLVGLTAPLFTVWAHSVSARDLILIAGGLFLLWKSTKEIHGMLEGHDEHSGQEGAKEKYAGFWGVIAQIIVVDLVFSLDSIITAVGMVDILPVMIAAVVASVGLMMAFAGVIGKFVANHPTIKMLALSFLVVVGVVLIADGLGHHVPKGYIYFAMAFSVGVEILNLRVRKQKQKAGSEEPPSENAEPQES